MWPARARSARRAAALGALLLLTLRAHGAETVEFSGDSMETVLAKGAERTVLSGHAYVRTEENEIHADRMELEGKDFQFIRCRGNVQVVNASKGIELDSQELFYDRREKVLRVNGAVVMVDRKNELVVKGGFLQHWESSEETVIQIGVRLLKKDLVCRSEYARYLRPQSLLELSGMPLVNRKGDEYRALKIFVDLDKDTIRMEGEIRGKVVSEEKAQGGPEEGPGGQGPGASEQGQGENP
jgi:lipopolysaccharide export system protein LptA